MIMSPREAFYCNKETINFNDSVGQISGESIMCYPPGCPIINQGELINEEIINYLNILKLQHCQIQGMEDQKLNTIQIIKKY